MRLIQAFILTILILTLSISHLNRNTSLAAEAAVSWYVAPAGSDSNSCTRPASPCKSIDGAIAMSAEGDTIYLATGVYTNPGAEQVVTVSKDVALSGGWKSVDRSLGTPDPEALDWLSAPTVETRIPTPGSTTSG